MSLKKLQKFKQMSFEEAILIKYSFFDEMLNNLNFPTEEDIQKYSSACQIIKNHASSKFINKDVNLKKIKCETKNKNNIKNNSISFINLFSEKSND